MGGNHTESTIVHVCGPEGKVNSKATVTEDGNIPSPVEERRTHDSSWKDDLYGPVRRPLLSAYNGADLVGRRIEVGVDSGGVHLPLLKVSGFSKFPPGLCLVVDTKGKKQTVKNSVGQWDQTRDLRSAQHVLEELVILDLHRQVVLRNGSGTRSVRAKRVPNLDSDVVRLSDNANMRTDTGIRY